MKDDDWLEFWLNAPLPEEGEGEPERRVQEGLLRYVRFGVAGVAGGISWTAGRSVPEEAASCATKSG